MKANIGKFYKSNHDRRINVKIEGFDTWSLDHTLAFIILPALLQLKETKQGVPSEFGDVGGDNSSNQYCFDFYSESHNDAFEQKVKQWDEVLDKMIWSFEQLVSDNYDDKYHHGKAEYDFVQGDKTYSNPVTGKQENLYHMVDKNPGKHWYDHVGHMLHEERIQEGLDLFGKYYRALWD